MADRPSTATIGLALLAAGEVPNFLAGMLPSLMTIQRFGADEHDRKALRRGELAGSVLALGVGLGAALASNDAMPAVATIAVLVVMLGLYEHAIRNPRPGARSIDDQPSNGGATV